MSRTEADHNGMNDVEEISGTVPGITAEKDKERKEKSEAFAGAEHGTTRG